VEIDTMSQRSRRLTYGQALQNYAASPHPTRDMVEDVLPEGWLLASAPLWVIPLGRTLTAISPGDASRLTTAIGAPEMKGMQVTFPRLPKWEVLAPALAVAWGDEYNLAPWVIAAAIQVVSAGLAGLPVPKTKAGEEISTFTGVSDLLKAWGYVPPTRVKGGEVNGKFAALLSATVTAYEEAVKGTGPRLPFDTSRPGVGAASSTITVGGRTGVDKAAIAAERHAAALAAFGAPATAPAPTATANGGAVTAAGAATAAVVLATAVKVKGAEGVVEVTGDPAALLAAIDEAVVAGTPWALFTPGGPVPLAARPAALAALRAALPPSEEDFFAV
jgi:hypothetical protein